MQNNALTFNLPKQVFDDDDDHNDDDDDGDDDDDEELAHGWRPPRGGKRAQRDSALKLIVIHFAKFQNWGRCDDLWQTVQPGPLSESQAQQLQAAALISNCWGNIVD